MPQFDQYTTPGSAVAQTLQEILMRRREESRRAMLDKLAEDEQMSVRAAREAQTAQGVEQLGIQRQTAERQGKLTDAQIAQMADETFRKKLSGLRVGAKPEDIQDEAMRKQMENEGLFKTEPMFGPPSEDGTPLAPSIYYPGSAEQQDAEAKRSRIIQMVGETPGLEEDAQLVAEGINPTAIRKPKLVPATIWDPDTKKITTIPGVMVPEGTEPQISPRALQTPAAFAPKLAQIYKDGQWVKSDIVTSQQADELAGQGFELRYGNTPTGSTQAKTIAPNIQKAYLDAKNSLSAAESKRANGYFWQDTKNPSAEETLAQQFVNNALGLMFADDPAPQELKELAADVLTNPKTKDLPVSAIKSDPPLTTEDQQALGRLLYRYRGAGIPTQ